MSETGYPQESVYNLLPKEEVHEKKPPRYISKFRPTVVLENKLAKDSMRMMGPAKVDVPSPDKYLKKHSMESKLLEKSKRAKEVSDARTRTVRKPPVPRRTDRPTMEVNTKKESVKTAAPVQKTHKHTCVDMSNGHKQLLENSGLLPKYILKKDYGKTPAYLQLRYKEEQWAHEEYNRLLKERMEKDAPRKLSDEEQQSILEGLKKRWDYLNGEYQALPLTIVTRSRKAHKKHLEDEMDQLQEDIDLFKTAKNIYVPKD
ncbi:enkurin [Cololabis saira]|uniref:enkurin n=1 Tax=Cololabis saira TaxID=129043 RepID=UPI002AD2A74D|nr:enkurin [Cololabis saira]